MTLKSLKLLGAAAAIFTLLAFFMVFDRANDSSEGSGYPQGEVFPGIGDGLRAASAISIETTAGGLHLTFVDGAWGVAEKDGYPADLEKVRALLIGVANSKRVEPKTGNQDLFERLELGESARRILINSETEEILSFAAGKHEFGSGGQDARTYIFYAPDARAWLISGLPRISTDPNDWVDKEVASFSRSRISGVAITEADGSSFSLLRPDAGVNDFSVGALSETEELSSQAAANSLATTLTYISFEDVKRDADDVGSVLRRSDYAFFDGLLVAVELIGNEGNEDLWARLSARIDVERLADLASEEVANDAPDEVEIVDGDQADLSTDAEETETSEDPGPSPLEIEVTELNSGWQGWLFKLASFKASDMTKKRTEIVQDKVVDEGETEG